MSSSCKNCGHNSHCSIICTQQHKDGEGNDVNITCCTQCRCDDCSEDIYPYPKESS